MSSCDKFVFTHSCRKLSSNLPDVAFVAVLTFDLVDNIPSVIRFEIFLTVRNESSPSFGGLVGNCVASWFEQSCGHLRYIFTVRERLFLSGFCSSIYLLFQTVESSF